MSSKLAVPVRGSYGRWTRRSDAIQCRLSSRERTSDSVVPATVVDDRAAAPASPAQARRAGTIGIETGRRGVTPPRCSRCALPSGVAPENAMMFPIRIALTAPLAPRRKRRAEARAQRTARRPSARRRSDPVVRSTSSPPPSSATTANFRRRRPSRSPWCSPRSRRRRLAADPSGSPCRRSGWPGSPAPVRRRPALQSPVPRIDRRQRSRTGPCRDRDGRRRSRRRSRLQ